MQLKLTPNVAKNVGNQLVDCQRSGSRRPKGLTSRLFWHLAFSANQKEALPENVKA
jgi:hypothetical protein